MWLNDRTAWTWQRLWPLEDRFWRAAPRGARRPRRAPGAGAGGARAAARPVVRLAVHHLDRRGGRLRRSAASPSTATTPSAWSAALEAAPTGGDLGGALRLARGAAPPRRLLPRGVRRPRRACSSRATARPGAASPMRARRRPRPLLPAAARGPVARGWSRPRPTAAPFHDWNAADRARVLPRRGRRRALPAADGRIARIVNTLEWISFDFGPTLLDWLEREAPDDLRAGARRRPREPAAARRSATPSRRPTTTSSSRSRPAATRSPRCAGASPTSGAASAAIPRGCGCRRRRWTTRRSTCCAETGSASPILAPHQVARPAGARAARAATAPAAGARSRCSSTTARSRTTWPSARRSRTAARGRGGCWRAPGRAPVRGRRRDGRRDLRPPPPLRRDGAGADAGGGAGARRGAALDQLRRGPRRAPAGRATSTLVAPSSWSCAHGVERWRDRLRLPRGAGEGLAPALARAAAGGGGVAGRRAARACTSGRRARCSADPWAARDAYGGRRRPRRARRSPASSRRTRRARRSRRGGGARARAPRDGAGRAAAVHLVRLVLRRRRRPRAAAGAALRRARHRAGRARRGARSRPAFAQRLAGAVEQRPRGRRRARASTASGRGPAIAARGAGRRRRSPSRAAPRPGLARPTGAYGYDASRSGRPACGSRTAAPAAPRRTTARVRARRRRCTVPRDASPRDGGRRWTLRARATCSERERLGGRARR